MANPYPTSSRALVTFDDAQGKRDSVEYELDPPTNNVAEVEKRWRDDEDNEGKTFHDADLLPGESAIPPAEPVLANETIPAQGTPTDPQIVRERASGREETDATTPEEDLPKADIKPVKKKDEETFGIGDKHPLSFFDGKTDEQILSTPGVGEATLADIKKAQAKRDKAKK